MNEQNPIVIKSISKRYKIAHLKQNHHSIKDAIVEGVKKPLELLDSQHTKYTEEMWALKDVSFEVKPGQVMAVMGRNGSGKSTLFKILSRITTPTSGEAIINGRVGSLIEVDAGFHPELTGRENVFFHGAILGMTTEEIRRNFDSILEFAEIDKFIDTPVKFYSSGMKVRLAFSVAIHMETDILLLDEVLAVGDYIFKQKCFKVIGEMAESGKTILFVSHIPGHIRRICTDGVLLKDGQVAMQGTAEEILDEYLKDLEDANSAVDEDEVDSTGPSRSAEPEIIAIQEVKSEVINSEDDRLPALKFSVNVKNITGEQVSNIRIKAVAKDASNNKISVFSSTLKNNEPLSLEAGAEATAYFVVPEISLRPGEYNLLVSVRDDDDNEKKYDKMNKATTFEIEKHAQHAAIVGDKKQDNGPNMYYFDCEIK